MTRDRVLQPVVQESTPSIIARQLREAIAIGDFAPGAQLTETGLAGELGVSRGPLREAMQRLTQEGLLVSYRNRGLFVLEMDDDSIFDMYLARTAVERAALARVISRCPNEAAVELAIDVDAMRQLTDDPNGTAIADADLRFHATLVNCAASERLSRLHQTMLVETRMCLGAMRTTYGSADERVDEHQHLVDAIADRNARHADELMVAHMRDGLHRLVPGGTLATEMPEIVQYGAIPVRPTTTKRSR